MKIITADCIKRKGNNLNLSFVSDNKNFWKVVKPLLTVKGCVVGNNTVISEKKKYIYQWW